MNRASTLSKPQTHLPDAFIDLDGLRTAAVVREPFPFFIVPRFVRTEALDAIRADFPAIRHPALPHL